MKSCFERHKTAYFGAVSFLVFVVLVGVVCFFPYWFTRDGDPELNFRGTGEIGDTIGGIMGPFIAIIAAFLTFLAFLIQYDANELQRRELKRQDKLHKREHFESQLYVMLNDYKSNVSRLKAGRLTGKDAVPELVGELSYIYSCVRAAFVDFTKTKEFHDGNVEHQNQVFQYIVDHFDKDDNTPAFQIFLALSYSLFFYGRPYISYKIAKEPGRMFFENEIYQRLLKLKYIQTETTYTDYAYDLQLHITNMPEANRAHYKIMQGHNDQLGSYFRQLYQIVTYIADADEEVFSEADKYRYAKLLRCQMTDSEQILLYYNSFSELGSAWAKNKSENVKTRKDLSLIGRFLLIKNLPGNFPFFGITPMAAFHDARTYWEYTEKKRFFEHETFMVNGNSMSIKL